MKALLFVSLILSSVFASASSAPESILGYVFDEAGVTVQVATNGCTKKEDFVIDQSVMNQVHYLRFRRQTPDFCKGYFRYGMYIHFFYSELGIEGEPFFRIVNTIDALGRP